MQPAASNSAPIALLLTLKWKAMIQPPAENPRRTFLQAVRHFPATVFHRAWRDRCAAEALAALSATGADIH
jgi:hypothetical protein